MKNCCENCCEKLLWNTMNSNYNYFSSCSSNLLLFHIPLYALWPNKIKRLYFLNKSPTIKSQFVFSFLKMPKQVKKIYDKKQIMGLPGTRTQPSQPLPVAFTHETKHLFKIKESKLPFYSIWKFSFFFNNNWQSNWIVEDSQVFQNENYDYSFNCCSQSFLFWKQSFLIFEKWTKPKAKPSKFFWLWTAASTAF